MSSSSLTRDESAAIKGIATLLIVFGHCKGLVEHGDSFVFHWLYSFHVFVFFILPWIYNKKRKDLSLEITDNIARCVVPYVWFYILAWSFNSFLITHRGLNFTTFWCGFFVIDPYILKETVGASYMWFLPFFFVFLIVTYFGRRIKSRSFLFFLCLMFFLVNMYMCHEYRNEKIDMSVIVWIKTLSLYLGSAILGCLLLKYHCNRKFLLVCWIVFISILVLYFSSIISTFFIQKFSIINSVVFFLLIYRYRQYLCKLTILKELGIYSLPIYLMHLYYIRFFEMLMGKTYLCGLISFVCSLFFSYLLSLFIYHYKTIKSLIFPSNIREFFSVYKL